MVHAHHFLLWGDYHVYGFHSFMEGDDCVARIVGNSDEWYLSGEPTSQYT